ncbi:hypothetical protein [Clostridium chromiireducens]|uniref:Uncharacterized protein n=1 Tax=Clostridium chromiireducens TaxID=225345 RepID=A0A1V4IUI3_9CLOT|nr:hypothetical protein [Clostridium chromiireducens]OPJ63480.1 hypothetical protein CLCHR_15780 [Clostridium chromiireducens]RII32815.1 hypothetical protein D2A34_21605 [Clostridium chromiireducens]
MRYIGPFFRMNSLSSKEISGQLFHLSKESIKTLVLNSKCGLLAQVRTSKKSSIDDISILNNFSPLLCMYRKASPLLIHSKSSHSFDESSFKKEITPSTNALMTLCLLELSEYYSHYNDGKRNIASLEKPFKYIAKEQLQFYSENLRNNEGLFVDKKNISEGNSKGFSLVDTDDKFKFSDQAFMMAAYMLYAHYNKSEEISSEYIKFSNEILDMFKNYKSALYELSFNECVLIFLALNIFYKYSCNSDAKRLILDLGDFLISKFQEKDYYLNSIDDCSLFSICLMEAYKHTDIISFKETAKEINDKLVSLYDSDKHIFVKISDKKESKYSCLEVNFYLLSLLMYSFNEDRSNELRPTISNVYRKFFVNGGLLTSWPDAPTLDEVERYRKLSLRSDDMLDETFFRMPVLSTPKSTGLAPIFVKSLTYSKRKDSLSSKKSSFDSNKNMLNFFLIIFLLKDTIEDLMEFTNPMNCESQGDLKKIQQQIIRPNNPKINIENISADTKESTSILLVSETSNDVKNLTPNALTSTKCIEKEEVEVKNIVNLKKINKISLLNKDTISKVSPPKKKKKYKKNKNQHPHNKKS